MSRHTHTQAQKRFSLFCGADVSPVVSKLAKPCARVVALFLIIGLNWVGLLGVGESKAYFTDTEHSTQNVFEVGSFSVSLVNNTFSDQIGVHTGSDTGHTTGISIDSGSIAGQYALSSEITGGENDFCEAIETIAWKNGVKEYEGDLFILDTAAQSTFGTWEFDFRLPQGSVVGHSDICTLDIVFSAWQGNLPASAGGFTEEKRLSLSFTATMVVLNEVYPNEDDTLAAPNEREWVEFLNNGNAPVDIEGWAVSELTGGSEVVHTISAAHTCASGSKVGFARPYNSTGTVIAPGGSKVIEFCALNRLKNDGDTILLYDNSLNELDSVTYDKAVPKGQSIARSPEGIGIWFDPIPTPGTPNKVSPNDPIVAKMHPEEAEAQKKGEFDFEQYVAEHSVHQEKMRELGHFPGEGEYTLSPNQKVPQQQEPKSGEEKEVNIVSADPVNEERGELEGTEESEHDPLPRTSLGASEDEQKEEGSADTPPSVSSTPQQQALPEDTLMEEAKEEDAPLEVERREEDAIAQDEIPEANEQKDPPHTQEPVDLPEDLEEEVKIEEEGEQDKSEDEEVTEGATKEEEQVTSTSTTEEETPVVKEEEQQEVVEETVPENTETDEEASRDEETE